MAVTYSQNGVIVKEGEVPHQYEPQYDVDLLLGGRAYRTVRVGTRIWLAENLVYRWNNLSSNMLDGNNSSPAAAYYNDDESTYGVNGLIYNGFARIELKQLISGGLLSNWRIPTYQDFDSLASAFITEYLNPFSGTPNFGSNSMVKNLKSSSLWDGKNAFGFNLYRSGYYESIGGANNWSGINLYTCMWCDDTYYSASHYDWGNDTYLVERNTANDNRFGCVIRLCKDIT